jgi:hypothetical protein
MLNTPTFWKIVTMVELTKNSFLYTRLSQFVHEFTLCFDKKTCWGEEFNCSYSNSCDLQAFPLTQEPMKTIFLVSLTRETQHIEWKNQVDKLLICNEIENGKLCVQKKKRD